MICETCTRAYFARVTLDPVSPDETLEQAAVRVVQERDRLRASHAEVSRYAVDAAAERDRLRVSLARVLRREKAEVDRLRAALTEIAEMTKTAHSNTCPGGDCGCADHRLAQIRERVREAMR